MEAERESRLAIDVPGSEEQGDAILGERIRILIAAKNEIGLLSVKDFDLGVFRERYVKRKNEAATKS